LHGRASDRSGGYRGDLVIACVGAGLWGRNVIRNFHDLSVLFSVCNPKPEARARITANHAGVRVTGSLGDVLEVWLREYNEVRPHPGRWRYSKTPMRTFVESLSLAKEKMLAA